MIRRTGYTFRISRALGIAAVAIATVRCGPDLSSPASNDVSGTWFAAGPSAGFTNITIKVTQSSDGTVSGTYTATSDPSLGLCPLTTGCPITGTLTGANTVFQVFFLINGLGQFTGQRIDQMTLKGAMSRLGVIQPIEFTKS